MSVYYVLAPDLSLLKIGFAEKPRSRFTKIQSDSPVRLVLLAIEDGDESTEAERHAQFAEFRHRGEWFRDAGALHDYVHSIPALGPKQPSLNAQIVSLGVSRAHASQIVNEKHNPSLSLAVAIWRLTGWKCPRIAHATNEQLEVIEQIDRWIPRARQAAA